MEGSTGSAGLIGLVAFFAVVIAVLAAWIGCGSWASSTMRTKGRSAGAGWVLGLVLGPFGMLIAAMMGKDHVELARLSGTPTVAVGATSSAQQPSPPISPTNELERLATLHSQGRLTDDEYARAKAQLLGT